MKILLVEDDREIRTLLAEILEDHGHFCVQAEDGLAAKEILLQGTSFQLLITDFRMPRMDGAQLLLWCREQKIHFPAIFISANTELLDREKMVLSDCCAAFLRKPIGIDQLIEAVEDSTRRRHVADCLV